MSAVKDKSAAFRALRKRLFVRLCSSMLLILGLVGVFLYFTEKRHDNELLKRELQSVIEQRQQLITEYFSHIQADLFYLSELNELEQFLADPTPSRWQTLSSEYLNFIRSHQSYDQIRFLSAEGREVARANYNFGKPNYTPVEQLQDKSHRYYFQRSVNLLRGEVFASVFDLNMENRRVEVPHKPVIRFATSVFADNGEKAGVLIINYLGDYLLEAILRGSEHLSGQLMLLNPRGYWLLHPDVNRRWGFMVEERGQQNFASLFPDDWSTILASRQGQFNSASGLMTFSTVFPPMAREKVAELHDKRDDLEQMSFWKLVIMVPQQQLAASAQRLQLLFAVTIGTLVILFLYPCWKFAHLLARRVYDREEIERLAHQDKLTGLTSRALFDDRLQQSLERASRRRTSFALLYLDLDGFKQVNDQFGHAVGDEILQNVALRLRKQVRAADTVARLGGDEFCILIDDIERASDLLTVAEKVVDNLMVPFEYKGNELQLGASVGISLYPQDGNDAESLLSAADEAMYQVKNKGKNGYLLAGDVAEAGGPA